MFTQHLRLRAKTHINCIIRHKQPILSRLKLYLLYRDEKLQVLDYCQRNLLDMSAVELSSSITSLGMGALISSVAGSGCSTKSGAWLTLIQNSSSKTCEMIILFDTAQDRVTWLDLIQPGTTHSSGEKIYETWSCPSVEITQDYQDQHLILSQGDTANVLRKSDEGKDTMRNVGRFPHFVDTTYHDHMLGPRVGLL